MTGDKATLNGNVVLGAGATLQGFEIHADGGDAVTVSGDDCKVLNNKIDGHTDAAIAISGVKGTLVGGNSVTGDTSCSQGKDCGERGVSIVSGNGTVVADNLFYHNSYGVLIDGCTGCAIFRNKFDKNTEIELYVEGLSKTTVRGNRIEYSGYPSSATGVDGFGMRASSDVVIDRNFVDCHYYGMKVYGSSKVTFSNNVSNGIYFTTGGPYVVRDNNLHDLSQGIRLESVHDVTVGRNSFCNNKTNISGSCGSCTIDPGVECP